MNPETARHKIFITGGTGYVGSRLIPRLLSRGHEIRALVRTESEGRLPAGCTAVPGNALDTASFAESVAPADTFIQLIGTPKPSPAKTKQFREVDLVAGLAGLDAARRSGIRHFVYVSVAHPAPIMKTYIEVREQVENAISQSAMSATILRPWYVLGPGHHWPYALIPVYAVLRWIPSTRETAHRLGLVTLAQMVAALIHAVENPAEGIRIVEVPQIRQSHL